MLSQNEPKKKRLANLGRFRVFWLLAPPKRGETRILFECGYDPIPVPDLISTGAWYLGIGRLTFTWLTGFERPSNVLEFRRGRKARS